jgi:hypothetical protein
VLLDAMKPNPLMAISWAILSMNVARQERGEGYSAEVNSRPGCASGQEEEVDTGSYTRWGNVAQLNTQPGGSRS